MTQPASKPWWKRPWKIRRATGSDEVSQATVEAGGREVDADEVEGPNSL